MLYGLLLDLVPFMAEFKKCERDWMNGPMREWWGMDGLLSQAQYERNQAEWRENPDQGRSVRFGMRAKDGTPIGVFGVFQIDYYHRTAEVGAGIGDPAYWGGGFGSDAMLLIVDYAFAWLDLRRLWLTTMGQNVRAQRQVEKCGFKWEASRREELLDRQGDWQDFLYYGMLRDEWPGRAVMIERLGLREKAHARGYLQEG